MLSLLHFYNTRYGRLIRFGAVGLLATVSYACIVTLFYRVLPFPAAVSSFSAYALCAIGSYIGHRSFTFGACQPRRNSKQIYVLLSLSGHAVSILVPAIISDYYGLSTWLSTAFTCILIPLSSALLTSRLVFGVPLVEGTPAANPD